MGDAVAELLSRDECLSLLPSSRVGRVGVSIGAIPAILPVNFLPLGDSVLFRTSGASELFRACVGSVVAFEVDDHTDAGLFCWTILMQGVAIEITDATELRRARLAWLEAWHLGERADRFVVVPPTILSGMRFPRVA